MLKFYFTEFYLFNNIIIFYFLINKQSCIVISFKKKFMLCDIYYIEDNPKVNDLNLIAYSYIITVVECFSLYIKTLIFTKITYKRL
jgi:hypothetical protein